MSTTNNNHGANRQESHRIYLQLFTPQSSSAAPPPQHQQLHRHDSHQIHPPNYPSTTPGAPYRFSSASSTSLSVDSSYSFSSTSIHNNNNTRPDNHNFNAAPSSTITTSAAVRLTDRACAQDVTALLRGKFGLPQLGLNVGVERNQKLTGQYLHHQPLNSLQRGEKRISSCQSYRGSMTRQLSPTNSSGSDRLQQQHGLMSGNESSDIRRNSSYHEDQSPDIIDALVLVGTLEGPPKGYVSFEHEEHFATSEQVRLKCFKERLNYWTCLQQLQHQEDVEDDYYYNQQQEVNTTEANIHATLSSLPVSSSTATVRASGNTQRGSGNYHPSSSSSLALSRDGNKLDLSSSRDSRMGLDLSSSSQYYASGGANRVHSSPWKAGVGGGVLYEHDNSGDASPSKDGGENKKLSTLFSELSVSSSPPRGGNIGNFDATMPYPSVQYEPDLEPIHIVRTIHPNEHPLQVRDEMMKSLARLRKRAEEQMGIIGEYSNNTHVSSPGSRSGGSRRQQLQQPQVSFRWYFQPCSPLGGMDSTASSSPKIQSIPAYVELDGYCTDDEEESDEKGSNGKGGGMDNDYDEVSDEEDENDAVSGAGETSIHTRLLNKEKRRIAVLRELSDSPFVVSGYLLKQSQKDPNVWRRMYCVLSADRLWVIGRVRSLSEFPHDNVDPTPKHDVLSSMRIGSHSYINLLRSILIEREESLSHRLPNTFRIVTSFGQTHSFRAFNSQSFRSWTAALSEKIAQTHTDGMMDLANVITEEETLARCRRMEDVAVTPFLSDVPKSKEITPLSMDIVRFAMSVAEYREVCRKVDEAMQLHKNSGGVVNMQTRVGGSPNSKAKRAYPFTLSASDRARNEAMVSSVWEDARVVASKSAQLLHLIATSQHSILEAASEEGDDNEGDGEMKSSLEVDNHNSMKDLIDEQKYIQTLLSKRWKHQVTSEGGSDGNELDTLPPSMLFDKLLKRFHSFTVPIGC